MARRSLAIVFLVLGLVGLAGCEKAVPGLETPEKTAQTFIDRAGVYLGGNVAGPPIWECFTKADEKWFGKNYEQFFERATQGQEEMGIYYTYSPLEKAALGLREALGPFVPPQGTRPEIKIVSRDEKSAVVRVDYSYGGSSWDDGGSDWGGGGWDSDGEGGGHDPGITYRMVKKGPNWKIDGFFGLRK